MRTGGGGRLKGNVGVADNYLLCMQTLQIGWAAGMLWLENISTDKLMEPLTIYPLSQSECGNNYLSVKIIQYNKQTSPLECRGLVGRGVRVLPRRYLGGKG